MSAPTPAPGDDRPREGYYPDPSIPGYVRYWNGASWVPGTSRPAPTDGRPLPPPPGVRPAQPSVEETGPHFFDEDEPAQVTAEDEPGGGREPASAWGAEPARQSGFGGAPDHRVAWGAPQGADPRLPLVSAPEDAAPRTDGTATIPPADSPAPDGTVVFRRPSRAEGSAGTEGPAPSDGTMKFRALSPRTGEQGGSTRAAGSGTGQPADPRPASAAPETPEPAPRRAASPPARPSVDLPAQQSVGSHPPPAVPGFPRQAAASPAMPEPGEQRPTSWAQQVQHLASPAADEQPVAPWKPPVEDPFQAAARAQASARPAGLGRRLAARLLDTLVLALATGAVAVPLGTKAIDHVNAKLDAARLSGETVTVWLLDGTTSVYLAVVLAVFLGFGVLYEALPTARWGRTLGKKLCGLQVRDIEGHEPPRFGKALVRWLVYGVPGLLLVGVVGVLWCVFDRPWRQCWHDKAAHTFVSG
ncbi:RDD family protein [Streptomyces sp. RY43-2]|uniref:RDD family protein n=1 Tax=Streptomyces macrolidinus TaxID=2952607 RepID=A0ABT0Z648_9ACTN|nr:RDD family protein [Streptomyces macrolidinus]MCN9239240.1 RDD family protein [Streptomyces macrolidinus]